MFIEVLFRTATTGKQSTCLSADTWINIMWYNHKRGLFSLKKE